MFKNYFKNDFGIFQKERIFLKNILEDKSIKSFQSEEKKHSGKKLDNVLLNYKTKLFQLLGSVNENDNIWRSFLAQKTLDKENKNIDIDYIFSDNLDINSFYEAIKTKIGIALKNIQIFDKKTQEKLLEIENSLKYIEFLFELEKRGFIRIKTDTIIILLHDENRKNDLFEAFNDFARNELNNKKEDTLNLFTFEKFLKHLSENTILGIQNIVYENGEIIDKDINILIQHGADFRKTDLKDFTFLPQKIYKENIIRTSNNLQFIFPKYFKLPNKDKKICLNIENDRFIKLSPNTCLLMIKNEKEFDFDFYSITLSDKEKDDLPKSSLNKSIKECPASKSVDHLINFQADQFFPELKNLSQEYRENFDIMQIIKLYREFIDDCDFELQNYQLKNQIPFYLFYSSLNDENKILFKKFLIKHKEQFFLLFSLCKFGMELGNKIMDLIENEKNGIFILSHLNKLISNNHNIFKSAKDLRFLLDILKSIYKQFSVLSPQLSSFKKLNNKILEYFSSWKEKKIDLEEFLFDSFNDFNEVYLEEVKTLLKEYNRKQEKLLTSACQRFGENSLVKIPQKNQALQEKFENNDSLTFTYFNNAQFGLVRKDVISKAKSLKHLIEKMEFGTFIHKIQQKFIDYFQADNFSPENIVFYNGAYIAFREFYTEYLKNKKVAVSKEEYEPIVELFLGEGKLSSEYFDEEYDHMMEFFLRKPVLLPEYSYGKKNFSEIFKTELRKFFEHNKVNYILISEITRYGTNNTKVIKYINEVLDELSYPKPFLIIDGAQSFGRIQTDFKILKPDVYLSCSHKAGGTEKISGIIMLSNNFIKKHGKKFRDMGKAGTEDIDAMSQYFCAANQEEIINREQKIQALSRKFIELVKNYPKIQIITPKNLQEDLSGIFEINIQDCLKSEVFQYLSNYGISITGDMETNNIVKTQHSFRAKVFKVLKSSKFLRTDKETIRISIHEEMEIESILMLVEALLEISEKNKDV